jgi:hypothetical protein
MQSSELGIVERRKEEEEEDGSQLIPITRTFKFCAVFFETHFYRNPAVTRKNSDYT